MCPHPVEEGSAVASMRGADRCRAPKLPGAWVRGCYSRPPTCNATSNCWRSIRSRSLATRRRPTCQRGTRNSRLSFQHASRELQAAPQRLPFATAAMLKGQVQASRHEPLRTLPPPPPQRKAALSPWGPAAHHCCPVAVHDASQGIHSLPIDEDVQPLQVGLPARGEAGGAQAGGGAEGRQERVSTDARAPFHLPFSPSPSLLPSPSWDRSPATCHRPALALFMSARIAPAAPPTRHPGPSQPDPPTCTPPPCN